MQNNKNEQLACFYFLNSKYNIIMFNNRQKKDKKLQEKFDQLPSKAFRELFISSLKREIEKERKRKVIFLNKTKRELWINRMTIILNDLQAGVINDKQLKKVKKEFEKLRNEYILSTYIWVFLLILIVGGMAFITIITTQFAI